MKCFKIIFYTRSSVKDNFEVSLDYFWFCILNFLGKWTLLRWEIRQGDPKNSEGGGCSAAAPGPEQLRQCEAVCCQSSLHCWQGPSMTCAIFVCRNFKYCHVMLQCCGSRFIESGSGSRILMTRFFLYQKLQFNFPRPP